LETAHPIKFADVVEPIIGRKIPKPLSLAALEGKEKSAVKMAADYVDFKAFMLAR
jgi:threonine synthase